MTETQSLLEAVVRLPLAAVLGAALAMRPRRAGTPPRRPAVVQTQIILAVVGALVMIVVGASLARAFGVVGIAGLVRYRAKIDDPKDAGVMLAALGVGLAAGVGLYWLSPFATLFLLLLLYVLETSEPAPAVRFLLKVTARTSARFGVRSRRPCAGSISNSSCGAGRRVSSTTWWRFRWDRAPTRCQRIWSRWGKASAWTGKR